MTHVPWIRALCSLPLVAIATFVLADPSPATPDRISRVAVDRTEFVVQLASGRVLRGAALEGATLTLATGSDSAAERVRISEVKVDPNDPDREITLYHLFAIDPAGQETELCEPNADGERWGFPVQGQWDREGTHVSNRGYTLTCGDGAQGKCIRFGYKPWKTLQDGTSLEPYHQACIRAVRADYCGGHGTTRDGMLIDIYDTLGIQTRDPRGDTAGVRFEAAWTPSGATCVAHTRVPENVTLDRLATECPRLKGRLGEDVCTEDNARGSGATPLIYLRSR